MTNDTLPTLYVNHIEVQTSAMELFLSLGTKLPEPVSGTMQTQILFHCVVTTLTARVMRDALEQALEMTLSHEELLARIEEEEH